MGENKVKKTLSGFWGLVEKVTSVLGIIWVVIWALLFMCMGLFGGSFKMHINNPFFADKKENITLEK